MRKSIALCAACVLMAAALPAAAMSPPGKELVRLRHQVTALKAKVGASKPRTPPLRT